jgi:hypothetical protein
VPAIASAGVLGIVVLAGVTGAGGGDAGSGTSTSAITTTLVAPPSTTQPIVVATEPASQKTQLAGTIAKGSVGDDVQVVQQRLTDLGFAPGPVDGQFGENTRQAVWAYEKLVLRTPRAEATGQVTNDMWQGMQDDIAIRPRRPNGPGSQHMEIYLPEQVAAVFHGDLPVLVAHISSGELDASGQPDEFCETIKLDTDEKGAPIDPPVEKQICAKSKTPGGVFRFERKYVGKRNGPLGGMMNPVYFNFGIAVHGADNVPLQPASHGCVRLNQMIATTFQELVSIGDRVYVWGHDGKEPEQYSKSESLPSFNYADPNATTTTSTSTSTVPKATTTTTKPAPTTTKPAPTTTTSTTTTVADTSTSTSAPPAG